LINHFFDFSFKTDYYDWKQIKLGENDQYDIENYDIEAWNGFRILNNKICTIDMIFEVFDKKAEPMLEKKLVKRVK